MKRVRRIILGLMTAILTLACLASCVLWIWSERQTKQTESCAITERIGEKSYRFVYYAAEDGAGWVGVDQMRFNRHDLGGIGQGLQPDSLLDSNRHPLRGGPGAPWLLRQGTLSAWGRLAWWRDAKSGTWGSFNNWAISAPFWALAVLSGACPVVSFTKIVHRMRTKRRWLRRGLCPGCGYDMRATPERCPECGREAWER